MKIFIVLSIFLATFFFGTTSLSNDLDPSATCLYQDKINMVELSNLLDDAWNMLPEMSFESSKIVFPSCVKMIDRYVLYRPIETVPEIKVNMNDSRISSFHIRIKELLDSLFSDQKPTIAGEYCCEYFMCCRRVGPVEVCKSCCKRWCK